MKSILTAAFSLFLLFGITAAFAGDIREVTVQFKPNETGTTIKGSIKGRQIVDYRLKAKAGQLLTVIPQHQQFEQLFQCASARFGNRVVRRLHLGQQLDGDASSGRRLHGPRLSDAQCRTPERKGQVHTLDRHPRWRIGKGALERRQGSGNAVSRHQKVPCSIGPDPKGSAQCEFGVIRGKPGNAEVHVTPPGGGTRVLNFIGATVTIADPKARLKASKSGDNWSISIDDFEYYDIPMAVIDGG